MPKLTPQPPRKLIRVFEKLGYRVLLRGSTDHITMGRQGSPRPVVIPDWKEVPVFIIHKNLQTAGCSREKYFELLAEL